MDPFMIGLVGMVLVLVLIALRTPIAFALGSVALVCILAYFSFPATGPANLARGVLPAMSLASATVYELFHSYDLTAIPMFIALGHVCYRAGITSDIYIVARVWMTRVPGGLAMASVLGCAGFSTISGSSLACAATMGRVAVPEMLRYGYSDRIATGAVAAGGTLGALIPPSLLFILYALFAEQSISALFMAGVVPGVLSLLGYWLVIAIWASLRKQDAPPVTTRFTLKEKIVALAKAWPALVIFGIIIGGIYGGIFTATEAAAVSLAVAVLVALGLRRIDLAGLVASMRETAVQTAAIFVIASAAKLFVSFIALTGVAHSLVDMVSAMNPGVVTLMIGIVLVYLLLGMFLDPLGIMLLTLPFMLPLIEGQGLNLIWFGVIVVKLLEMGLVTPPVGLNVFVLSSVTEPRVPVRRVFEGVAPYFLMDVVVLGLLLAFPILSLVLVAQ